MIWTSKLSDINLSKNVTITDLVMEAAARTPDRIALIDIQSGRSYTYSHLKRSIINAAWALRMRGFSRGDVACFCSTNNAEYVIMFHAVLSLGGIVTPVNPLYTVGELENHLKLTTAKYIFTKSEYVRTSEGAAKLCTFVKSILVFDLARGYTSCLDLISEVTHAPSLPEVTVNCPEEVATIPASSGTTGFPKGVMLTHENITAMTLMLAHDAISAVRPGRHDTLFFCLPLFHIYGISYVMAYALHVNSTIILADRFDLPSFLDVIQKYKVTVLPVVPSLMLLLAKHPLVDSYDVSSVRAVFYGGAPIGEALMTSLTRRLTIKHMCQAYGLTEMSPFITCTRHDNTSVESVGVVISNTDVKVIDIDTSELLGVGKEGEICARGPQMMKGYLNNAAATAETIDRDGWLHTGDLGYVDEDGNLFITGRRKELIKYNAFQVAPAELEKVLLTHPAVADVGVIGVPDERAGELPRAYVVRKEGATVTETELYTYTAERTAPYKKLRGGVRFIDEIPKSPSGKIIRRKLAENLQRDHIKSKM